MDDFEIKSISGSWDCLDQLDAEQLDRALSYLAARGNAKLINLRIEAEAASKVRRAA